MPSCRAGPLRHPAGKDHSALSRVLTLAVKKAGQQMRRPTICNLDEGEANRLLEG